MTKEEEKIKQKVYEIVLFELMIQLLEDSNHKQNIKRQANILKDLLVKSNNINFDTPKAVQEIMDLCEFIKRLFDLNFHINSFTTQEVENFNKDLEFFLKKYKFKF